jgi:hypothetical protein
VTFFTSHDSVALQRAMASAQLTDAAYNTISQLDGVDVDVGFFEQLQMVDTQHIQRQHQHAQVGGVCASNAGSICVQYMEPEGSVNTRGYLMVAYKTMEDMYNRDFVCSWKTWTGVRLICAQLPAHIRVRRIAFYRNMSGARGPDTTFTYVLLIEVANLIVGVTPIHPALHFTRRLT